MDEARERALLAELYANQERERIRAEQNAPDWRVRTRDGPEPPRRTRGLDTAPPQDWSAINRRIVASLDDYGRRFVSELIAEALAHERKRLQREVDVLRAMQAETRAQQGELRAALDVVRAQLRSRGRRSASRRHAGESDAARRALKKAGKFFPAFSEKRAESVAHAPGGRPVFGQLVPPQGMHGHGSQAVKRTR